MSKIKVKAVLKSKNSIYNFSGKAIKKDKIIIYKDKDILTKIELNEIISIERKKDYYLKLNFKNNKTLDSIYQAEDGTLSIKTETKKLIIKNNSIMIKYNLIINNVFIDTFLFYLKYTIDR